MKARLGFVSNSSSASFIILWRINPDESLEVNLRRILEFAKQSLLNVDLMIEYSKILVSDIAETRFWTYMYNGVDDFGPEATSLVSALVMKDLLINARVNDER